MREPKRRRRNRLLISKFIGRSALLSCLAAGLFSCDDAMLEEEGILSSVTSDKDIAASHNALSAETWGIYNNHLYAVFNDMKTWEDARDQCEGRAGHLVTFADSAEMDFVVALLSGRNIMRVWIGLTDQREEGTWRWLTGEPTAYTHWASGEPNNAGSGEDYAAMYSWGHWLDLPPTWTAAYVCEFGGSSYRLFDGSSNRTQAAENCENRGGYLAAVGDAGENTVVSDLLLDNGLTHGWIGYTDVVEEGTFRWPNWENTSFTSWTSGEPNNANGNEHYTEIRSGGSWNDLPENWTIPSICEFGRPSWNAAVTLDLRESNGDDLADAVTCLPWGSSCNPCPSGTVSRTLSSSQQNASAQAKFLIIEKGQGIHDPESQSRQNEIALELVDSSNNVTREYFDFGTGYENDDVNYRPNGDVVVSLAAVLSDGKKIKSISFIENYSLGILCRMGIPYTRTYYYSKIILAK